MSEEILNPDFGLSSQNTIHLNNSPIIFFEWDNAGYQIFVCVDGL